MKREILRKQSCECNSIENDACDNQGCVGTDSVVSTSHFLHSELCPPLAQTKTLYKTLAKVLELTQQTF